MSVERTDHSDSRPKSVLRIAVHRGTENRTTSIVQFMRENPLSMPSNPAFGAFVSLDEIPRAGLQAISSWPVEGIAVAAFIAQITPLPFDLLRKRYARSVYPVFRCSDSNAANRSIGLTALLLQPSGPSQGTQRASLAFPRILLMSSKGKVAFKVSFLMNDAANGKTPRHQSLLSIAL